jgi:hypothetical protein
MGKSFLSVMSNHQPLERLKLKNGIVNLIARRRVDGAKPSYPGVCYCRTFLACSISMIVFLEKSLSD